MTNYPYMGVDISSIPEDEYDPFYDRGEPAYTTSDALADILDIMDDDDLTDDEAIDEIDEIMERWRNDNVS
ncbi:MAG: hypothetical protein GDA45_07550 [Chromatiales bacterium]|nr:hypothetical protein [Chromatiales bacterium]